MQQKSKLTAYLLWFFLGGLGAHKFYLGKTGMGIAYIFTLGFCGVGLIIDLFTLGNQVDLYNAVNNKQFGNIQNTNNVVVNVASPMAQATTSVAEQLTKLKELKEQGHITEDEFNTQKGRLLNS